MSHYTGIRWGAYVPTVIGMILATAAALAPPAAPACSTPVYRVAMYDWRTAPYHVFYFYRGQVPEEDAKVNRQITEAAEGKTPANVLLHAVDLADQKEFGQLPEIVQKAWKADHKEGQPLYLVYAAWPVKLFAGRLDAAEVAKLIDSPKRAKLGELLEAGNATVFLILAAPDKKKTEKAEKAVGQIVAEAAAGKILTGLEGITPAPADYLPETPQTPGSAKKDDPQKPEAPTLKVASLTVSRTDPAEQWLVRALVAAEPDLHEYAKEPMVFAVLGRGRALPPFVGKGITPELLTEAVAFVTGPCSCTVKEQNPGADLLMSWDWKTTAETLAASDPSLQWQGEGLGYQEIEPAGTGQPADETAPNDETPTTSTAAEAAPETKPEPKPQTKVAVEPQAALSSPPETEKAAPAQAVSAGPEATGQAVASEALMAEEAPDAFAARQTWRLAIGIGLAAVVILGASLTLLRRH